MDIRRHYRQACRILWRGLFQKVHGGRLKFQDSISRLFYTPGELFQGTKLAFVGLKLRYEGDELFTYEPQ